MKKSTPKLEAWQEESAKELLKNNTIEETARIMCVGKYRINQVNAKYKIRTKTNRRDLPKGGRVKSRHNYRGESYQNSPSSDYNFSIFPSEKQEGKRIPFHELLKKEEQKYKAKQS